MAGEKFKSKVQAADYKYNAARGVELVLSRITNNKKKLATKMLTALSKHTTQLWWDRLGNITMPISFKIIKNVLDLLNLMMYKERKTTASSIRDATTLLTPLNDVKLLNMIQNTRLKEALDDTLGNTYLQYSTPIRPNAAAATLASSSSPHTFKRVLFPPR